MKAVKFENKASGILSVLSNPFRIRILFAIGKGEACVCHLEAVLKKRQAFISQHLMVLRKAGILDTRREGKYIFYRLADQETIALIRKAGKLAGLEDELLPEMEDPETLPKCCCPHCESNEIDQPTAAASLDVNVR
ncbi:MAG: metalloregulator ArsR/SmtB family transcription factor [Anaerolineaceae bacterium]|nr:metalloregulator ArsR/SmtB family transcription factor [Anaerolineaceae bacterium]